MKPKPQAKENAMPITGPARITCTKSNDPDTGQFRIVVVDEETGITHMDTTKQIVDLIDQTGKG